ncbi:MAG TPA: hypothetical protein VK507_18625, partial [Iamia sp.]|nr:hypothetical protein [Iamia sp.]
VGRWSAEPPSTPAVDRTASATTTEVDPAGPDLPPRSDSDLPDDDDLPDIDLSPQPPETDAPAAGSLTHTLTVHTDGCGVIRSTTDPEPDNLTWSFSDEDGFSVLGRNALGETRYRYFSAGTYTVVLEAWGGDSYVPISNEVTVHC